MIGCLQLASPDEAALHALRLRLDRLSPRVQLWRTPEVMALLLDLGRGTMQDGRRHAAALRLAADAAAVPSDHVGIAHSPTLAALAARRAASDGPLIISPGAVRALLARCPVSWLAPLTPLAPVLHGLGLRTLGAVAALPAAAVSGRFGTAALQAWRALHGEEPPLTPVPHPPRLGARRSFVGPVDDRGALMLALAHLVSQLARTLERRGAQARVLALHLHGDDGPWSAARVLERPAAGAQALTPIAAGLLAAAGCSGGVEGLTLLAGELVPVRGEQLSLFEPAAERHDAAHAALGDLAARLTPGALLRPSIAAAGTALVEERGRLLAWGVA